MRIQVVSDLHVEFRPGLKELEWWTPSNNVDVLVVAGDACAYDTMHRFSLMLQHVLDSGTKVVYVPGNHETYDAPDIDHYEQRLLDTFAGRQDEGLFLLSNDSVVLEDTAGKSVTFIGSVLYSDLSNPMDSLAVRGWPDFRVPGHSTDRHTQLHKEAVAYLHDTLYGCEGPAVVVTHFVPSYKSVHERFKSGRMAQANPYFTTDLEWLMAGPEAPLLWIHGHTHDPYDYHCGKTRVVCNPYGYPRELRKNGYIFDKAKIIEV